MSLPEGLPGASSVFQAPTVDEVERVSQIDHPPLRNLLITQCYWELSKAFSARTGASANWCTFATWASKQAGVSIRGEDLQRALGHALRTEPAVTALHSEITVHAKSLGYEQAPEKLHASLMERLIASAVARTSDAVARGNKKVFEEIGREFARFIAACGRDEGYTEANVIAFCETLRAGDPPDGQDYLKRAFSRYYKCFFEPDDKIRQEMLLLSNVEVGYHEQTRLQPEIAESLDGVIAAADDLKDFVANFLLANMGVYGKIIYGISVLRGRKSLLNRAIEKLVIEVRSVVHRIITAELMTLTIPPDTCLRLGRDLQASFPQILLHLTNQELIAFLSQIDPTSDSLRGTGAADWSVLKQRLHYIADLFRCYQDSKDLFDEAFSNEQLLVMRDGQMPPGRL